MNTIKTGLGSRRVSTLSVPTLRSAENPALFLPFLSWPVDFADRCSGAWFEHDLHALSEQQKADCVC